MTTIRLPSGVRDFLPRAATRRRALAERVMAVFETWGYQRVVTPVFECADVLERGLGDAARASAIRFVEPGTGEIVALRPDITPQIARVVATRMTDITGPIRLCYEGAVMRLAGERGQHEILQAGIELVERAPASGFRLPASGSNRDELVQRDAEVVNVAAEALAGTQLPEVHLDLGHVAFARFVLGEAPVEAREAITASLAKKDRAGLRAAAKGLPIAPLAEALGTLWGPPSRVIARARELPWPSEVMAAIDHLEAVLAQVEVADPPKPEAGSRKPEAGISLDLSDLRGFDYYTGMRLAGFVGGAPDAVLRGGRYDELLGRYGHAARATGFAIDLEAVAQAQRTAQLPIERGRHGVAVVGGDAARALAKALRARGVRAVVVESAPDPAWLAAAGLDRVVAAGSSVETILEELAACPS